MSSPTGQALNFAPSASSPTPTVSVSSVAGWVIAIDTGGLTVRDSPSEGAVVRDLTAITDSSRRTLTRPDYGGTTLRVRLLYNNTDGKPVSPLTIRVFGTKGSGSSGDDFYGVLRNLNGDASVPIYTDPDSDPFGDNLEGTESAHCVTQPDNNAHSWDCDGCNRLIIAVERTYQPTGMGADAAEAYLQAKIV